MSKTAPSAASPPGLTPLPKSRGGRPTREETGLLTERLLEAGLTLFLENGYELTSIERIAGDAGVSKRTFYSRFPSKADLFEAVIFRWLEEGMAEIEAKCRHVADAPVEEWLTVAGLEFLEFNLRPQTIEFNRVVVSASKHFPELATRGREVYLTRVQGFVHSALDRFHARGEINVGDTAFAAELFFHSCIGYFRYGAMLGYIKPQMTEETHDMFLKSVDFFLHGCRAKRT